MLVRPLVVRVEGVVVDVRGEGPHVRAAVLRRPTLAVEFALFGDVAPVAHTARFVDHGVELAGEPRWSLRGGVGVRYVGP